MGWFDWLCCRPKRIHEEEVVNPSTSSPSSDDYDESSSAADHSKMGKAVSKVKSLFTSNDTTVLPGALSEGEDLLSPRGEVKPLAYPRSPLRRSIGTLTPPDSPLLPPVKRIKSDEMLYMDFPVLREEAAIQYIQRNKVMFIMKGLSGSGKSHLTSKLKEVYVDAVVCSADHYFIVDGEYQFDVSKLKDAHSACQNRARKAAQNNCHVIIIDNTNIRDWESNIYRKMCGEFNYIYIFMEPKTPWSFNPTELSQRSSHGLEEEFLAKKLEMYQQILPTYYGWFLNESDSQMISKISWQWLEKALLEVEPFYQDFSHFTDLDSIEEMLKYFTRQRIILHVTACFTGRGKSYEAMSYINDPKVMGALGRCYPISVIGYVITPKTFGARIQLTEEELQLWGFNDDEMRPDNNMKQEKKNSNKNETKKTNETQETKGDAENIDMGDPDCGDGRITDICGPRIKIIPQIVDENRFCPTSGKGSRAHITLGCADGIRPVITGFDMIDIVACEQTSCRKSILNDNDVDFSDTGNLENRTYNISGALLKSYGNGRWVVYPDTIAVSESVFAQFL